MGRTPKQPRKPYGEWLRYLRTTQGLTQTDVQRQISNQLGLPNERSRVIAHWETTGKLPGREILLTLCKTYNCTLETLLGVKMQNGKYEKIDSLLDCVRKANEQRIHEIKTRNNDPFLNP